MQTTERVTITIPVEMKRDAQLIADERHIALSAVVSEALASYLRTQALQEWVAEYEAEFGVITEEELIEYSRKTGVPYSAPQRGANAA